MSIRVLVVEDEFMIGLDVSRQLAEAGFQVVGPATSVRKALRLVARRAGEIAVRLDINLGGERSEPIVGKLRASGKPFVVLTGYSTANLRPWCRDATTLTKPPHIADPGGKVSKLLTSFEYSLLTSRSSSVPGLNLTTRRFDCRLLQHRHLA